MKRTAAIAAAAAAASHLTSPGEYDIMEISDDDGKKTKHFCRDVLLLYFLDETIHFFDENQISLGQTP
jgi:hypothetical protein